MALCKLPGHTSCLCCLPAPTPTTALYSGCLCPRPSHPVSQPDLSFPGSHRSRTLSTCAHPHSYIIFYSSRFLEVPGRIPCCGFQGSLCSCSGTPGPLLDALCLPCLLETSIPLFLHSSWKSPHVVLDTVPELGSLPPWQVSNCESAQSG